MVDPGDHTKERSERDQGWKKVVVDSIFQIVILVVFQLKVLDSGFELNQQN